MCRSEAFPPKGQFLLGDNVDYLIPNATQSVGYLVIVPQMRFDCHGYITGWSALTQFNSEDTVIDTLNHDITFQLWRPSTENSGIYTFVGSNNFEFIGSSLRDGLTVVNDTQFFSLTASVDQEEMRLAFQPGDVVGWYIHTLVQAGRVPLTIVYRDPTRSSSPSDPSLQPLDMYSTVIDDTDHGNTPPPCELSLCSDQTTLISSVIPYLTIDYGKHFSVCKIMIATCEVVSSCYHFP